MRARPLGAWLGRHPRAPGSVRTEEILPPSQGDEGSWVFLTGCVVLLVVMYVIIFERFGGGGPGAQGGPAQELMPFQVLFRDLPGPEQRMFRQMQEGALEALRIRGSTGQWPAIEALAGDGIPPFTRDVLDRYGFRWSQRHEDLVNEYVGVPAKPGIPAFLILVREPPPGAGEQANPAVVDEEHQLLADGTLLHVTYWKKHADTLPAGVIADPALEGWKQIRVKTLFEEYMP